MDDILASNPTIQTNLTLYFLNRHNYQRYHYTNLFACVQAIVRLSKDKEWIDKSAEIQEMFNNPMKKYFEKYQRLLPLKISLSRLEFIAWRDQHFNLRLNKIYYIDDRLDLEFGQILDVLEFFKNELHICLSDFLERLIIFPKKCIYRIQCLVIWFNLQVRGFVMLEVLGSISESINRNGERALNFIFNLIKAIFGFLYGLFKSNWK